MDTATKGQAHARRHEALKLRLAGCSLIEIGHKLAADPAINTDGVAHPQGYGAKRYDNGDQPPSDAALYGIVGKDIERALKANLERFAVEAVELRHIEGERLDAMFQVAFAEVTEKRNLKAILPAVRIMQRRAKMLGLDAPVKLEVDAHTDAQLNADIETLIAELVELGVADRLAELGIDPDALGIESSQAGGQVIELPRTNPTL